MNFGMGQNLIQIKQIFSFLKKAMRLLKNPLFKHILKNVSFLNNLNFAYEIIFYLISKIEVLKEALSKFCLINYA